jgi:hypothetical protein
MQNSVMTTREPVKGSNLNNFVTLTKQILRLSADDADALKHVGVLTIYKILLIYIYTYIYIYSAFGGLDNKQVYNFNTGPNLLHTKFYTLSKKFLPPSTQFPFIYILGLWHWRTIHTSARPSPRAA